MKRTVSSLILLVALLFVSACAATEDAHRTEKVRENADRGMRQLHEEEGHGGY
jgi:ABC-type Fe3+-citrate transport system substrate-binding protein